MVKLKINFVGQLTTLKEICIQQNVILQLNEEIFFYDNERKAEW